MAREWIALERQEGSAHDLSLYARALHAQLHRWVDGEGHIPARLEGDLCDAMAKSIAFRFGATKGDRRLIAGHLRELAGVGAVVLSGAGLELRALADGADLVRHKLAIGDRPSKRQRTATNGDEPATNRHEPPRTATRLDVSSGNESTLSPRVEEKRVEEKRENTRAAQPTEPLALAEPETGARAPSASAEVRKVFEHWREKLDHKGAKLDAARETAIRRALKSHGLTVVLAAIDGCAASDWHRGSNPSGKKYDALGLILRNAEKIETFAAMATASPTGTASASGGGGAGVRPSAPTLAAHRPAVAPQLPTVGAPLTRPAFLRRTAEPVAATQTAEEDMPW